MLPPGRWKVTLDVLPTYADSDGEPLRLVVIADGRTFPVTIMRETGNSNWAEAVLDNRISTDLPLFLCGGRHRIGLAAEQGGILVEALRFIPADR
jgi:hypothetical protein